MNRRQLLQSALATGASKAFLSNSSTASIAAVPQSRTDSAPELIGSRATAEYFDEKQLWQTLGTTELDAPKVTVIAFNFPSWHTSPVMEKLFGKGWNEYQTLQNARSLFPGHSMPHFPLWGYYDEADPVWAAREIELAVNHGVDAWMIDWYWHEGVQFYHEQIEQGLLRADNRDRIKFAVMWANHDWKNVYPARSPDSAAVLIPQVHSYKDFAAVANYCAEKYFPQSNYLTLDGAPVFALFDASKVIAQLGEDGLKRSLHIMRERSFALGFPHIHIQVCNGFELIQGRLKEFGFDSVAMYGTMAWTYGAKPPGSHLSYGLGAKEAIETWKRKRQLVDVPFHPTCCSGWDDSPRFGEFSSIAVNRTPDQFERLVRAARHFVSSASGHKLLYIGAWNEWTEDSVILPDTYWGYSYVEALKRAVK